jgi:hypothetical protein
MYVKGQMDEMNWGVDFTSYKDVVELVKSLGYRDFKSLYYRHPQLALSRGLRPLNCDDNVLTFIEDIKGYEVVEVYLEHLVDTPILIEEDIHDKGKWKRVDEEVVIDVDDEYEGDGDYEDEVEGGSDEVEGESDKVDLNDTEDEDYVADNEEVSDDYTIDESDFEGNWD